MKIKLILSIAIILLMAFAVQAQNPHHETSSGWTKYEGNPVLGGKFGTIFDISVLRETNGYIMYCSWRPKKSIAISESKDGLHWSDPKVVLGPDTSNLWESDLNRPVVVKRLNGYYMWYTGQYNGESKIGYTFSKDGRHWIRKSNKPVLSPELPWEKTSVMCPHVIWDGQEKIYKMWYSAGEQYEPDAIGYATSKDGMTWKKHSSNPVFVNDPKNEWEQAKVTACQVIKLKNNYYMFYIGFKNVDEAQIGIAKSKDGVSNWVRNPQNPIISPGKGWDASAVYKPFTIYDGNKWLLWYNGRHEGVEQIGVAIHRRQSLGF